MNNPYPTNKLYSKSLPNQNNKFQPNSSNNRNNKPYYNSSSTNYYQRRYNSMKGISKKKDISLLDGASYLFTLISLISLMLWDKYSPFDVVTGINARLFSLTILATFFEFGCFIIFINISSSESLDLKNGNHWIVIFLFFISFFMSSNLMIRVINAFDFRSKVIITTEYVKNRKEKGYVTRNKRGEECEHRSYYLILRDENETSGEKTISVSRDVYENAGHGDHWISKYKPGLLGIKRYSSKPYIVHNHVYENYWNEQQKRWKEEWEEKHKK